MARAGLRNHWFLIALGVVFAVGFFGGGRLEFLLGWETFRGGIVFAVMWATGVTLRAEAVRRSVASPLPAVLAIGINLAVVPAMSLAVVRVAPEWLIPYRLAGGLFVATLVPCTLASAAVWTRRAGGDDSVALLTTVVTNLACVFVVPVGVWVGLGQAAEVSAAAQMAKLTLLVAVPLLLAQAMRAGGVAAWADRHTSRLGTASQIGILAMVLFGAIASSRSVAGGSAGGGGWYSVPAVIAAGISIHVGVLWLGVAVARALGVDRPRQIAVGFSGSQKTLMIGLQIAIDSGVSVVPMITYHLAQLFLDTLIADRWRATSGSVPARGPGVNGIRKGV